MFGKPLIIIGWAVASFCGGCGLAILYNGTWRNVLYVGVIALIGNEVRLLLHDSGVPLPLATFLGAFAVGLTASIAGRWIKEARVALTVPAVVMMVPGLSALETLVYFDRGEILKGALGRCVSWIRRRFDCIWPRSGAFHQSAGMAERVSERLCKLFHHSQAQEIVFMLSCEHLQEVVSG